MSAHANYRFGKRDRTDVPVPVLDIRDILLQWKLSTLKIDLDEAQKINITRRPESLWKHALRCYSRGSFDLKKVLRVELKNESGQDEGGLRREFFEIALRQMLAYPLMEARKEGLEVSRDMLALVENKYRAIGRIYASAIIQGAGIPPLLSHPMVSYAQGFREADLDTVEDIEKTNLIKKILLNYIPIVYGSVTLEVGLMEYRHISPEVCDDFPLFEKCDPFFEICFETPPNYSCDKIRTTHVNEKDELVDILYNPRIKPNPISQTMNAWHSNVTIRIQVWDANFWGENELDLAMWTYEGAANVSISKLRLIGIHGKASVTVYVKINCDENYYDPSCTEMCIPTTNSVCDKMGKLICKTGFTGSKCGMVIQQTTFRTKSRMNTSEQTLSMNSKQAITNSHFTSQTASPTQNYTNQIERSPLLGETKSTLPQSSIYGTGTSLTGSTIISNNSNTTKYLANSSQLSKRITELLINQTEYSVPISSYLQNNNVSIANMHQTKTDKDKVQNILNISTSRTSHLASYFSTFASIATLRTSLSKNTTSVYGSLPTSFKAAFPSSNSKHISRTESSPIITNIGSFNNSQSLSTEGNDHNSPIQALKITTVLIMQNNSAPQLPLYSSTVSPLLKQDSSISTNSLGSSPTFSSTTHARNSTSLETVTTNYGIDRNLQRVYKKKTPTWTAGHNISTFKQLIYTGKSLNNKTKKIYNYITTPSLSKNISMYSKTIESNANLNFSATTLHQNILLKMTAIFQHISSRQTSHASSVAYKTNGSLPSVTLSSPTKSLPSVFFLSSTKRTNGSTTAGNKAKNNSITVAYSVDSLIDKTTLQGIEPYSQSQIVSATLKPLKSSSKTPFSQMASKFIPTLPKTSQYSKLQSSLITQKLLISTSQSLSSGFTSAPMPTSMNSQQPSKVTEFSRNQTVTTNLPKNSITIQDEVQKKSSTIRPIKVLDSRIETERDQKGVGSLKSPEKHNTPKKKDNFVWGIGVSAGILAIVAIGAFVSHKFKQSLKVPAVVVEDEFTANDDEYKGELQLHHLHKLEPIPENSAVDNPAYGTDEINETEGKM